MTNYERWLSYTDDLPSPQNYVQWGWIFLVSAVLQRRVWCPPTHDPMFCNMFVTLVGKPGLGKDGVINRVNNVLTYWKLKDFKVVNHKMSEADKVVAESVLKDDVKSAEKEIQSDHHNKKAIHEALLFPDAPDATTYESLVQSMAQSYRHINYVAMDEKQQKNILKVYGHSSMYFCLSELESIFKKHTESLNTFLRQCYDSKENYRYKTKTQGEDRIRRACLSFLAGTTPDFMQDSISSKITGDGFSSRNFYIFALKNRKSVGFRAELNDEQKKHFQELLDHVFKLAQLYGQVQLAPETVSFYNDWCKNDYEHPEQRASRSPNLETYYSRKNIHIMKVAMALHFGETTDMVMPVSTFQRAIDLLHEEEKTMALALCVGDNNPLAKPSEKVMTYLSDGAHRAFNELLAEFWGKINREQLREVLEVLEQLDKVEQVKSVKESTNETTMKYKVKK